MTIPEKHSMDGVIGASALSSPLWLPVFQDWLGIVVGIAGLILLVIRAAVGIKELRKKD